jgi:hypothetical protein
LARQLGGDCVGGEASDVVDGPTEAKRTEGAKYEAVDVE